MFLKLSFSFRSLICLVLAIGTSVASLQRLHADEPLSVGSQAPELDIEHWVSDRNGELPKVTAFQKDNVYVVEFWGTWCGPCVASMPHLAELQDKYAEHDVQIISVTDEDIETVEAFLNKIFHGDDQKTYRELTAAYSLTSDPDKSVTEDYLTASKQEGIPAAFIVGKTGVIEWIGHPKDMDEPLQQIVDGKWDRTAVQEKRKAEHATKENRESNLAKLPALHKEKKFEECLTLVNEMIAEETAPKSRAADGLKQMRLTYSIAVGGDRGIEAMNQWATEHAENTQALSSLAFNVYSFSKKNKVDDNIIELAYQIAKKSVEKAREQNDSVANLSWKADTIARLLHKQGKLDEAIVVLQEVLKEDSKAKRSQTFLDKLMAEKKEASSKDSSEN